jgi:hypothetical protein
VDFRSNAMILNSNINIKGINIVFCVMLLSVNPIHIALPLSQVVAKFFLYM